MDYYKSYTIDLDNRATINYLTGRDSRDDDISFITGTAGTVSGFMSIVKKTPGAEIYVSISSYAISTIFYFDSKIAGNILSNYNNMVDDSGAQLPREGAFIKMYPYYNSFTGWARTATFYDKYTGDRLGDFPIY